MSFNHLDTGDIGAEDDKIPVTPKDIKWLDLVDQSAVPKLPMRKVGSGICENAKCDGSDNEKCFESCGNTPRAEDVYGCKQPNQWALTFDDGPSEFTPDLLDILKKHNVKATFCVTGAQVEKYPQFTKRAHQEGHQIAMHTYSHPHLMSLSNEDIIYELMSTQLAIEKAIGVRPRYLRPPFGEADPRVKALAKAMDLKILMWNVDPRDYDVYFNHQSGTRILKSMRKVINSKKSALNVKNDPGFISLQHDLYKKSIRQVPKIIRALKKKKFQLTTVADCVGDSQPYGNAKVAQAAQSILFAAAAAASDEDSGEMDAVIQQASDDSRPSDVHDDIAVLPVPEKSSSLGITQNKSNKARPLDSSDANSSDKSSSSTPHSVSSSSSATVSYSHISTNGDGSICLQVILNLYPAKTDAIFKFSTIDIFQEYPATTPNSIFIIVNRYNELSNFFFNPASQFPYNILPSTDNPQIYHQPGFAIMQFGANLHHNHQK
ncbi:hypothetical protein BCR42DRAFT_494894 [Absidia repens]|uniref:NodB homology domain-containing protein n=1 Tax=Absidia repens TaxID=90262 RepID=A0A1X2I4V3_9FUNG|nr:hypothetical protein BCR42DRAFT_494894 [Absidia repens]